MLLALNHQQLLGHLLKLGRLALKVPQLGLPARRAVACRSVRQATVSRARPGDIGQNPDARRRQAPPTFLVASVGATACRTCPAVRTFSPTTLSTCGSLPWRPHARRLRRARVFGPAVVSARQRTHRPRVTPSRPCTVLTQMMTRYWYARWPVPSTSYSRIVDMTNGSSWAPAVMKRSCAAPSAHRAPTTPPCAIARSASVSGGTPPFVAEADRAAGQLRTAATEEGAIPVLVAVVQIDDARVRRRVLWAVRGWAEPLSPPPPGR